MSEWVLELAERLIVGRKRDGRCVYDAQAKQELILACGRPGISMAKLARDCGINANLLSTWVRKHERKAVALPAPAFVAAVATVAMAPAFVPVHIEAPAPQAQATLQMQARLPIRQELPVDARSFLKVRSPSSAGLVRDAGARLLVVVPRLVLPARPTQGLAVAGAQFRQMV